MGTSCRGSFASGDAVNFLKRGFAVGNKIEAELFQRGEQPVASKGANCADGRPFHDDIANGVGYFQQLV